MSDVTFATFESLKDLQEKLDEEGKVPIGMPISNSVAYVLDQDLNPVPRGATGQLYVSSPNLCSGYVGFTKNASFKVISKFESLKLIFEYAFEKGALNKKLKEAFKLEKEH